MHEQKAGYAIMQCTRFRGDRQIASLCSSGSRQGQPTILRPSEKRRSRGPRAGQQKDMTNQKNRTIRLTDSEWQALQQIAQQLAVTRHGLIIKILREITTQKPYLWKDDLRAIQEASRQVRSVGVLLNQIARVANTHDEIDERFDANMLGVVLRRVEAVKQALDDCITLSRNRTATIKPDVTA